MEAVSSAPLPIGRRRGLRWWESSEMVAPERTVRAAPALPRCAFCGENGLTEIIDFGDVALAGAFLKQSEFPTERKFPLRTCFCPRCYAVQVTETVDPSVLFKSYFYFSSAIATLREH